MHFDHGAVQRHRFDLDAHNLSMMQLFEHPIQNATLGPAIHAGIDGVPIAEPLRQTAPFAAVLGDVQDRIEYAQIGEPDVAALYRKTVFDLLVLLFGEFHLRSMPHQ